MNEALPSAVLFVCNYNTIRSAMAEGLLARRFGKQIWVDSVGVRDGADPDGFAIAAMDELGVDISRHRPKRFEDMEDASFDLIITLTPEAHHRALEWTRTLAADVEYWPTFDPSLAEGTREQRMEVYRQVRDALDARIAARFAPPEHG
jgi:protein-tyrosine-phosphatase